jgi:glyoxylase-like metal-dependent hydrolase (beta-lactamase superfamily II)
MSTSNENSPASVSVEIGKGGAFALQSPYALDGRVSTHPVTSRGYAPNNAYLLIEGDEAMLIDPGFSAHQDATIEMVEALITPETQLTLWALRIGEFASMSNIRAITDRFPIETLHGGQAEPPAWADFRPEFSPHGTQPAGGSLATVTGNVVRTGEVLDLGSDGRRLEALDAPLRLLSTNWVFDSRSQVLLTEDAFNWVQPGNVDGPWVVTADDDETSLDQVIEHLVGSRFWWLAGAHSESIRDEITTIFDNHEVEAIAPACGAVISSREAVDKHLDLLLRAMQKMELEDSKGIEVGTWKGKVAK